MDKFAMNAMKSSVNSQVSNMKASLSSSPIKWESFNYPPLLNLIHYSSEELPDSIKGLVKCIHSSFLILIVIFLINVVNCIVQTSQGGEGINIFYSFLNILIFVPLALFTFYRGYKGLASDSYLLRFYKIAQIVLILCYFIFSIISAGAFNGWVRAKNLMGKENYFTGALSIIESALYDINGLLAIYCVVGAHKYRDTGDNRV